MRKTTLPSTSARRPEQTKWYDLSDCAAPSGNTGTMDGAARVGAILPDRQMTAAHMSWTAEQKERMTAHGYDGMDSMAARCS